MSERVREVLRTIWNEGGAKVAAVVLIFGYIIAAWVLPKACGVSESILKAWGTLIATGASTLGLATYAAIDWWLNGRPEGTVRRVYFMVGGGLILALTLAFFVSLEMDRGRRRDEGPPAKPAWIQFQESQKSTKEIEAAQQWLASHPPATRPRVP